MSVTAVDFLNLAAASLATGTEIDLRNCVSRAYYSVYHHALPVAEAYFEDQNANFHMGDHERLSKRFHDGKTPKSVGIGYVLEGMKRQRRRADYDLDELVTAYDAQHALAQARAFPARLAQCVPQQAAPPATASSLGGKKK